MRQVEIRILLYTTDELISASLLFIKVSRPLFPNLEYTPRQISRSIPRSQFDFEVSWNCYERRFYRVVVYVVGIRGVSCGRFDFVQADQAEQSGVDQLARDRGTRTRA